LSAKLNMRVTNPTTAAQYFHLLRRQATLLKTDPLPLIVMTPKSLLRNPAGASTLRQLTEGRWQPLIDDEAADPDKVTRLVLCSGKFYFDLIASDLRAKHPEVAIARVEQLYPFPADELKALLRRYNALREIVWAQEEPKNMGAWQNLSWRLIAVAGKLPVNCVGRRRSPSPAEGSQTAHKVDQQTLVEHTYTFQFDTKSVVTLEKPHA
jgi:2-oxoglutarate dehydrogenase E1 component